MATDRLNDDVIKKISGPAWEPLRTAFLEISDALLSVSPEAVGVLTTIYVKFQVSSAANSSVYAVAWLKSSKQIVVGLALPDEALSPVLRPPPKGMTYKGLSKYFTVQPGDSVPPTLEAWARTAFERVKSGENEL